MVVRMVSIVVIIAIYPREGTETDIGIGTLEGFSIAIYPREGTETFSSLRFFGASRIAIYPREGTETAFLIASRLMSIKLQFIPARGRKHRFNADRITGNI